MQREDRARIRDMIDEAEITASFVTGRSRGDLDQDQMLFHALVRAIEVIGEAASKVSLETRSATPQIPWRDIVAMRNRLIHAYSAVDPEAVWKAAKEDIPALLPILRALDSQQE